MKINRLFIKGLNCILAGLLGLLGFSGCDISGKEEYGTPHATYVLKGKVTDKAAQTPIQGIRVGFNPVSSGVESASYRDLADTTDINGNFNYAYDTFPYSEETLIYVNDIDGEQNGLYRDTVLTVNFDNAPKTKQGDGWYAGEFTLIQNIEPEEKTDE